MLKISVQNLRMPIKNIINKQRPHKTLLLQNIHISNSKFAKKIAGRTNEKVVGYLWIER